MDNQTKQALLNILDVAERAQELCKSARESGLNPIYPESLHTMLIRKAEQAVSDIEVRYGVTTEVANLRTGKALQDGSA